MALEIKHPDGDTVILPFDEVLAELRRLTAGVPVLETVVGRLGRTLEATRSLLVDFEQELVADGEESSRNEEGLAEDLREILLVADDVFKHGIREPGELYRLCQDMAGSLVTA